MGTKQKEEWLSAEMPERRICFADAIYSIGRVHSTTAIMNRLGANDTIANSLPVPPRRQVYRFNV